VKDKPPQAVEGILKGKLEKFLLDRLPAGAAFVKNPEITIKDHLTAKIAQWGEPGDPALHPLANWVRKSPARRRPPESRRRPG